MVGLSRRLKQEVHIVGGKCYAQKITGIAGMDSIAGKVYGAPPDRLKTMPGH